MPKLNPAKFELAEYKTKIFEATPEYGETLAEVMDPMYFAHCSLKGVVAGSEIIVKPIGLPWRAHLQVVHVESHRVLVKLLSFADLSEDQVLPAQAPLVTELALGKFKAERVGAWVRVVRVEDGAVMKTGLRTIALAKDWALDNLKVELA